MMKVKGGKPTLFSFFYCSDQIVHKVLQIADRIPNAGRSINLRERRIEYGDDILQQLCCRTLLANRVSRWFTIAASIITNLEYKSNQLLPIS
jgi:hypothetical protein